METVLYLAYEAIRHLAIICQPFMPESCHKMLDQLGVDSEFRQFVDLKWGRKPIAGLTLPPPEPIFPRLEKNI